MGEKLLRLVALSDDAAGPRERGCIDGEELTISTTIDGEITVGNGVAGFFGGGRLQYGWEDLVPDFRRGEPIRLELQIIDKED